ncbi:hypothetical protein O0955_09560 [Pedobacter sp. HCMS5-2]|uniref:Uncharacterized protein n=2 Tax=Pedobacter punctiformis TaxID=3004097 RepID=A0ABT4L8K8_9SPHI|nr:hypothetical protein [Pedobacter sp. HCMS5-2]
MVLSKAYAQRDSTKTTVTLAAMYNSNISYYGQVTAEKYPYALVNATVRLPIGFYFSAGAYKLLNFGSGLSETDLGIGYDHDFNEKLTGGLSFTHSFFPANSPLLQASNTNNINASLTYNWPWLKTTFSTDYAFGKEKDWFLSLNNSKEIGLGTLFNEKNLLSIEPAFEITAGTTHFYETYIIEKIKKDKANGNGKSETAQGQINSNTISSTNASVTNFKLLAYSFKLPLSFSRGHYLAELSYQFSILGNQNETGADHHQSFFGLSMYYQF